jgi:hypothetical protein
VRVSSAILIAATLAAGSALAAERPVRPRLCPDDLPDGAHLPVQAGCETATPAKPRGDGFRDLGNGTSVRIGGRVGAEYGVGGR